MSLEHIVPQCLGGAYIPNILKTRRVCKKCNNNLGQFVDASFAKNSIVFSHLQRIDRAFYTPTGSNGVALTYIGIIGLRLKGMKKDDVCEFYGYVGGNPRTVKTSNTRAYFFFSDKSQEDMRCVLLSFRDAFKGRKVKKICGTPIVDRGNIPSWFTPPTQRDKDRIEAITGPSNDLAQLEVQQSFNVNFDIRFAAKLALGIGFCLFGDKALLGAYATDLKKAIWLREEDPTPSVQGKGFLTAPNSNKKFVELTGHPHAVTLLIIQTIEGVSYHLNIAQGLSGSMLCVKTALLTEKDRQKVNHGLVFIMFRQLKKTIQMSRLEFISHKNGTLPHPELSRIEAEISQNPYAR
ncbi:MAG: hypothetical protein JKY17_01160 [Magnetovibrio sp.]|nr:hypothetical protein [Magnetovibrio sp.]